MKLSKSASKCLDTFTSSLFRLSTELSIEEINELLANDTLLKGTELGEDSGGEIEEEIEVMNEQETEIVRLKQEIARKRAWLTKLNEYGDKLQDTIDRKNAFDRELRRASLKGDHEYVQRLLRYALMEKYIYRDSDGKLHNPDGTILEEPHAE